MTKSSPINSFAKEHTFPESELVMNNTSSDVVISNTSASSVPSDMQRSLHTTKEPCNERRKNSINPFWIF